LIKFKEILKGVYRVFPEKHIDERGNFSEDYNKNKFSEIGILDDFVQDNISLSLKKFTVRGLHFQKKPFQQSKLIKVLEGSIFDVFIDLRKSSQTYKEVGTVELSKDDGWIYIPEGFAHGFCTLTENTKVLYKVNQFYDQESDSGIIYNDPSFNIKWPCVEKDMIISEKDKKLLSYSELEELLDF